MASTHQEAQMFQVNDKTELSKTKLRDIIKKFIADEQPDLIKDTAYAKGDNVAILHRALPDDSGPDNRIPVSYARRIINIVTGYMFKPGYINYGFGDEKLGDTMNEVFKANNEPVKTTEMGKQSSTHGIGYEYNYVDGDETNAVPRFVRLPAAEVIPIWSRDIEPELVAFMRIIEIEKDVLSVMLVDDMFIVNFTSGRGGKLKLEGEPVRHFYGQVPLAVYRNNAEQEGDFAAVEPLIDAYDVLVSDSMNEFDRFAWAYLLLKGMSLSQENAAKVKRMRLFENLEDTDDVAFLTKTIDTPFIQFMTDLTRSEIHRQSGIPNIEDFDGTGASGKTITKFIYMMEIFTDTKESYFILGLMKRIELINVILTIQGKGGDADDVNIIMNRNFPDSSLEQAEIFNKYVGHLSKRTLIENYADVVDDVDDEFERIEDEGPIVDVGDGGEDLDIADQALAGTSVQSTALNGAQIKSLVEIVQQVAAGLLTLETARALIKAAFPIMSDEQIEAILGNIKAIAEEDVE